MDQSSILEASPSAHRPETPALVSVCTTCRAKGAPVEASPGPALAAAIADALRAEKIAATVRPVQCLSVCQRPVSVAIAAPGGFIFLFGDLEGDAHAAAIAAFVASYNDAAYGFVPWKARPAALRSRIVARLAPAAWSPDDGRAPDQPAKEQQA